MTGLQSIIFMSAWFGGFGIAGTIIWQLEKRKEDKLRREEMYRRTLDVRRKAIMDELTRC